MLAFASAAVEDCRLVIDVGADPALRVGSCLFELMNPAEVGAVQAWLLNLKVTEQHGLAGAVLEEVFS
jgi:hypothetical protein